MSRAADCLVAARDLQEPSSSLLPASKETGKEAGKGAFFHAIDLWFERSRQRRELRELIDSPEDTFRDIGLSRYDVQREVRKPFWRE